MCLAFR